MSESVYTQIPDTSDSNYWIKTENAKDNSTVFVPRDKELHCQLKEKAREANPVKILYGNRHKK